jgi:serine/threonine protein kinase/DNA-binding beta-propeller fold protein YncE
MNDRCSPGDHSMQAGPSPHPSDRNLRAYANGELDAAFAEAIVQHLDACEDCLLKVASISSDGFLDAFRRARSGVSLTTGGIDPRIAGSDLVIGSGLPSTEGGTSTSSVADKFPEALVDHPDYKILRVLGRGGMGVVYLAHNDLMSRDEVLKVMDSSLIERPEALKRFQREIQLVARLRHDNIVTAYRAIRAGSHLVLAMEYVEGIDLDRIVKIRIAGGKGPLPVSNACYYAYQAALALQHAHEHGMVHRDIKPANLMLAAKGGRPIIKVLDFGLSKASYESPDVDTGLPSSKALLGDSPLVTVIGQVLGTPQYIAPEQINDSQGADIRADIYSLGCTLYYLLSGGPPFLAQTLYDMLQAHQSMEAKPLNFVRTEVPATLAALVAKMMAKEPSRRFQTPGEVALALEPFFRKRAEPALLQPPIEPGPPAESAENTTEADTHNISTEERHAENTPDQTPAVAVARHRPRRRTVAILGALILTAVTLGFGVQRWNKSRPGKAPTTIPSGPVKVEQEIPPGGAPPGGQAPLEPGKKSDPVIPPKPSLAVPKDRSVDESLTTILPALAIAKASTPEFVKPKAEPQLVPLGQQVDQAIKLGLRYLMQMQKPDGSWDDVSQQAKTGTTSQVTLALLTAGEKTDSPAIRKALGFLRRFRPKDLQSTYAIALQTMVFQAAEPEADQLRIGANAAWLEAAQIKPDQRGAAGSWSSAEGPVGGDNSNTQYALLGLKAASEAGVRVNPAVWELALAYWERTQRGDGGWGNHAGDPIHTSSMTCAGISSLLIAGAGSQRSHGAEYLQGGVIQGCGQASTSFGLQRAIDWLGAKLDVGQNFPMGQQSKHYFLCGLERAGRLAGIRFFGKHDWYRLGAEELLRTQDRDSGFWRGPTEQPIVATSFALMFLAKGRAPVLIYKLRHGPLGDWNRDPDDVRNLVAIVSRDRKTSLAWQSCDPADTSVADLLQAPVVFLNGHSAPEFSTVAKQKLRDYVEHGGSVLADDCCAHLSFDTGFRQLVKELWPKEDLKLLPDDHPVWRARHALKPGCYPLWGIERGGRTVVIYSRKDLSCFWNQASRSPTNTAVILATKVGQNIIEYAADHDVGGGSDGILRKYRSNDIEVARDAVTPAQLAEIELPTHQAPSSDTAADAYLELTQAAQIAILSGRWEQAVNKLEECPRTHLGWEWGYLRRLCQQQIAPNSPAKNSRSGAELSQQQFTLQGSGASARSGAVDKRLITARDNETRVPEVTTGFEAYRAVLTPASFSGTLAFSPDGKSVAAGNREGKVTIWEPGQGKTQMLARDGDSFLVCGVAFSPDGKKVAAATANGVKIYNIQPGKTVLDFRVHTGCVNAVAFSPDGGWLASGGDDKTVLIRDLQQGKTLRTLQHPAIVGDVVFSRDGALIASAADDNLVRIWNPHDGQLVQRLEGHTAAVSAVRFNADRTRLASASQDRTIILWDLITNRKLLTLAGHAGSVDGVEFSPDGKRLASALWDSTIRIWDTSSGRELLAIRSPSVCNNVAFSPDGLRLAASSRSQGMLMLWDSQWPFP